MDIKELIDRIRRSGQMKELVRNGASSAECLDRRPRPRSSAGKASRQALPSCPIRLGVFRVPWSPSHRAFQLIMSRSFMRSETVSSVWHGGPFVEQGGLLASTPSQPAPARCCSPFGGIRFPCISRTLSSPVLKSRRETASNLESPWRRSPHRA